MHPRLRALLCALFAVAVVVTPASAFENGHANPAKDLAPIFIPPNAPARYIDNNSAYLSKPAAASLHTMRICAVRDGVDLYPGPSTYKPAGTAYRFGYIQLRLWDLYVHGRGAPAAKPIPVPGGYVFTSNHGRGNAVDFALVRMWTWLHHHGSNFGWSHAEGARVGEGWHWVYLGGFRRPDPGVSLRFPNLRRGSGGACQGQAIKEVQRRLGLRQDGQYGKRTVRGVRAFQARHHLHVNGNVGSKTWLALRKAGRDLGTKRDPRTVAGNLPGQDAPMAGQDVKAIQGLLNARFAELRRPGYRIKVDGLTGPAFSTAVKRFQILANRRGAHLTVSGRVDDSTYAQLLKVRAKPTPKLKITPAGVRLVATFEGFRSCPYRDAVGVWTIGFGHTAGIHSGSRCLSRAAAEQLLNRDLSLFAIGVTRLVKVPVATGQYNAIVSFSYNVGTGALSGSTLLRELNQRHYANAANQFKVWNKAGGRPLLGLTRRRRGECHMYERDSDRRTRHKTHC